RGRLAGAVGAEDAEDLAALDPKRQVAHRHQIAEAARQVLGLDDGVAHGDSGRSSSTNAGTPAGRRSCGSSMRTRTRTTRSSRSVSLKRKEGVNSVVRPTNSTRPDSGSPRASTRTLAGTPTSTPASSPWGTKTSTK